MSPRSAGANDGRGQLVNGVDERDLQARRSKREGRDALVREAPDRPRRYAEQPRQLGARQPTAIGQVHRKPPRIEHRRRFATQLGADAERGRCRGDEPGDTRDTELLVRRGTQDRLGNTHLIAGALRSEPWQRLEDPRLEVSDRARSDQV